MKIRIYPFLWLAILLPACGDQETDLSPGEGQKQVTDTNQNDDNQSPIFETQTASVKTNKIYSCALDVSAKEIILGETVTAKLIGDLGWESAAINERTLDTDSDQLSLEPDALGEFTISAVLNGFQGQKTCSETIRVRKQPAKWHFGGIFATGVPSNFNNPLTGNAVCPDGYTSTRILGTSGRDYTMNICWREATTDTTPNVDWGGASGGYWNGSTSVNYNNPATGKANDCPTGYTAHLALGTVNIDYSLKYCVRPFDPAVDHEWEFGGMYSPPTTGYNSYPNPITEDYSCPDGFTAHKVMHSSHPVGDAPLFLCQK